MRLGFTSVVNVLAHLAVIQDDVKFWDISRSRCRRRKALEESFPLPQFSLDETERYLSDLTIARENLQDLHKMCRGVPGHLAVVRRMMLSGVTADDLLRKDPDTLPDFMEMEFRDLESAPDELKKLMAIVAFGKKGYAADHLGSLLGISESQVQSMINSVSFLTARPSHA